MITARVRPIVVDFYNFFFRIRKYAASSTLPVRAIFHSILRVIYIKEVLRRNRLSQSISHPADFTIPQDIGFLKIDNINQDLALEVMQEAKNILKNTLTSEFYENAKNTHLTVIKIRENLNRENAFLKFALQKPLLKSISNYIRLLPVIEDIGIWYSPIVVNHAGSSQLYHLDGQDVCTLQYFLLIEDVDLDNGPLVAIDAKRTAEIAKEIGYRKTKELKRIDDDLIKLKVPPQEILYVTGKPLEGYIVDTDRCFHYGSRKASKPRFLVVFQYYSPFAFVLPWKWWKKLPFANIQNINQFDEVERAVLGAKT